MAENQVDLIDIVPIVALPIFAGFVFGVWSLQLNVFGGFDFSQVWWSTSSFDLTPALLGAVLSSAAIVATNEIDGSNYESYEFGMIGVLLVLPLLYEAVPVVGDLLAGDLAKLVAWLLLAALATYISYTD